MLSLPDFDLGLERFNFGEFLAGGSGAVPGIDLRLDDPATQGLGTDVQLRVEVLACAVDGLVAVQAVQAVQG